MAVQFVVFATAQRMLAAGAVSKATNVEPVTVNL